MSSTNPLFVFEHSFYVGNYISGILYGIDLVLYCLTIQGLYGPGNSNSPRSRRFFSIYSTVLLLLLTFDIAVNAIWGEFFWIDGRDAPGGILAWFAQNVNVWYQAVGSTTVVLMIFMGDALLVYRLYILYQSNYYVIILPVLAYFAALVFAIIQLVIAFKPEGNFFSHSTVNWGVPYYAISISLNIIITLLIAIRLRKLGKAVSRALGSDSARMYTSVASMLVESAAAYSIVGIMFLVPFAKGSMTSISFGQVWAKLACICPQMIILRVATGRAWRRDVVTQATSTVQFVVKSKPRVHATGIELQSQGLSTSTTVFAETSTEKWISNGDVKSFAS